MASYCELKIHRRRFWLVLVVFHEYEKNKHIRVARIGNVAGGYYRRLLMMSRMILQPQKPSPMIQSVAAYMRWRVEPSSEKVSHTRESIAMVPVISQTRSGQFLSSVARPCPPWDKVTLIPTARIRREK